jgi:hypothetical protein
MSLLLSCGLLLASSAKAAVSSDLTWLDKSLTVAQEEKAAGRMDAGAYQAFEAKFRDQLAAAKAKMEPTTENVALHDRILARLDGRGQSVQNAALAEQPSNADARLASGQKLLEAGNYSAALAEANAVLARDPTNKAALILKHNSAGRGAQGSTTQTSAAFVQVPAKKSVATTAPAKRAPLAVAPPDPISEPVPSNSFPLLPLAGAAGLGAAAFTVYKRKTTVDSPEGFDEEHRPPYGPGQQFVAGALLSALAGAAIYLTAEAAIPVVMRYASSVGQSGMRIAQSEAGAIDLNASQAGTTFTPVNEVPTMLARVIPLTPGGKMPDTLGRIGDKHAFVTAVEDIAGLNAQQLSQKLGIRQAQEFVVISFKSPRYNLATPVVFDDPQFLGRGFTSGGAREFVIPNGPIPGDALFQVVK